jgi:hypothetical protein
MSIEFVKPIVALQTGGLNWAGDAHDPFGEMAFSFDARFLESYRTRWFSIKDAGWNR